MKSDSIFRSLVLGVLITFVFGSCLNDDEPDPNQSINLTIFHVNDQHSRLENFAKVKYIVEQEKLKTNVLLVSAGDIFSGNPVVDNYPQKGYPIIDAMNQAGVDITVIGNHEFDYGEATLKDRIEQSSFKWICANADMSNSVIDQPPAYATILVDNLKITFLGLVETNGSPDKTIPSSHPWKMQNIVFERPENVVDQYMDVKDLEGSDLYIALTHLGHNYANPALLGDFDLATDYPFFDLIIGGHTNQLLDTVINNIPVFMAGYHLNHLGKITLKVSNKSIEHLDFELIDLNAYPNIDQGLMSTIQGYNSLFPDLDDVIGYAEIHHYRWKNVGCFYTDALRAQLNTDVSFQNRGGIRDDLDQGDITKREIYAIDPFHNGTLIYTMTVGEIKAFLQGAGFSMYYSGIEVEQVGPDIIIKDLAGNTLDDNVSLSVGINDFVPAIRENLFPPNPVAQPFTTAETLIIFLENNADPVNYPDCTRLFFYQ